MASDNPMIALPITISTNQFIYFTMATGSLTTATISAATYSSPWDLASAVQTALVSQNPGFACSFVTTTAINGIISITNANNFALNCNTGPSANSAWSALGYSTAADTASGKRADADYRPPNIWISTRPPARDLYDRREHVGGETQRTLDGSATKRLTVSTPRKRSVDFVRLPPSIVLARSATGSSLNRDFETLWNTWITDDDGTARYYPDYTAEGTYTTYFLESPTSLQDGVNREDVDVETYGISIVMQRQE